MLRNSTHVPSGAGDERESPLPPGGPRIYPDRMTSSGMAGRTTILGVRIDPLTMDEAIITFQRLIAKGRPALAVSVNVDICLKVQRDEELREIYRVADLVLVDGTPMMWAARCLGTPLPGRVSGSDLVPAFCATAAQQGYGIFLLGAAPGVAERARERLEQQHHGLRIVGTYAPAVGFEGDEHQTAHAVEVVRQARPDVLFAAFGTPKQEKWLFRYRDRLGVPVSMGVGSTFDYLAGRLKRAPTWMQWAGIEWIYRLKQEPRRLWRRYLLDDPPFVYHVLKQRLRQGLSACNRSRS
jgi:N-acetylglucosaminyldiphosphoundecaprenol N-acetyl-beta-D-mannosaminyltransferase